MWPAGLLQLKGHICVGRNKRKSGPSTAQICSPIYRLQMQSHQETTSSVAFWPNAPLLTGGESGIREYNPYSPCMIYSLVSY